MNSLLPRSEEIKPPLGSIQRLRSIAIRVLAWTGVFTLNLPSALMGFNISSDQATIGILSALPCLWLFGACVVSVSSFLGKALNMGGVLICFTQVIPILQFIVGYIAINIWTSRIRNLHGDFDDRTFQETFQDGFAITLIAGAGLIALAFIGGLIVQLGIWICSEFREHEER